MEKKIYEYMWAGRKLTVEIGELAKQAAASCMVTYGESSVLTAVTFKKSDDNLDFFPLMVIYQEKLYAAGKIPGGFLKREGRPSEHETLTSRLIDRPLRPLFPEDFLNEVQVVNTVMSSDPTCTPEMTAMFGSSLAVSLSEIPFNGPIAGVRVGRVNNKLIINPTQEEMDESDIDLTVAGTKNAINMVEAGAKEVSEDDMIEAIMFGHEEIKKLIEFQETIIKEIGKEKMDYDKFIIDDEVKDYILNNYKNKFIEAIRITEKQERNNKLEELTKEVIEKYENSYYFIEVDNNKILDNDKKKHYIKSANMVIEEIIRNEVRRLITVDKIRPDGRKTTEIRPLSSRVDVLPRTHGSALFTRGQTQALSVVTLGSRGDTQIIDGLEEDNKRFMLHYNFPPFSVGETGRYGAPGRREIGHGALGERSLLQVLPSEEEFPYTIRVVSEILESNGSTSQASICAGCLALMAAGVPLKNPISGIAMGLIKENEHYTILSDIQGMEDHLGDMDFKVSGSNKGITALQMDIKIEGITKQILQEALYQAKEGRKFILDHMLQTLPECRKELSKYAPKVKMIKINPDKIRDVIGAGGKVITQIIEECNDVKIDIEQDGSVYVMHPEMKWVDIALEKITNLTKEVEVGKVYTGKVIKLEKFGAFVELWPGCEGLLHISKVANERIEKIESVLNVGDEVIVKCIGIDEKGRIDLSRKDALS